MKKVRGQASSPGSASDWFLSVPAEEAPVPSGAFADLQQPWELLVLARDIFVRCFVRCLMQNISGYEDCEGLRITLLFASIRFFKIVLKSQIKMDDKKSQLLKMRNHV